MLLQIPYLHFEKQRDFKKMTEAVNKAIDTWASHSLPKIDDRPSAADQRSDSASGSGHNSSRHSQLRSGLDTNNSPGSLHRILIEGYLKPGVEEGDVPPLQIRRTLDHYYYSHLESTSRRDSDQVVQRYTSKFIDVDPKMFMVDQLWLWILDDGGHVHEIATAMTDSCLRYSRQLLPVTLGLMGDSCPQ